MKPFLQQTSFETERLYKINNISVLVFIQICQLVDLMKEILAFF